MNEHNQPLSKECDLIRLLSVQLANRAPYNKLQNPKYRNLVCRVLIRAIRDIRAAKELEEKQAILKKIHAIRARNRMATTITHLKKEYYDYQ
jgi:hypothetical protein